MGHLSFHIPMALNRIGAEVDLHLAMARCLRDIWRAMEGFLRKQLFLHFCPRSELLRSSPQPLMTTDDASKSLGNCSFHVATEAMALPQHPAVLFLGAVEAMRLAFRASSQSSLMIATYCDRLPSIAKNVQLILQFTRKHIESFRVHRQAQARQRLGQARFFVHR